MIKIRKPQSVRINCTDDTITAELIERSISENPLQDNNNGIIFNYGNKDVTLEEISKERFDVHWFVIVLKDTEVYVKKNKNETFFIAGNTEGTQDGCPVLAVDRKKYLRIALSFFD